MRISKLKASLIEIITVMVKKIYANNYGNTDEEDDNYYIMYFAANYSPIVTLVNDYAFGVFYIRVEKDNLANISFGYGDETHQINNLAPHNLLHIVEVLTKGYPSLFKD